jgi:hypothetical protein
MHAGAQGFVSIAWLAGDRKLPAGSTRAEVESAPDAAKEMLRRVKG